MVRGVGGLVLFLLGGGGVGGGVTIIGVRGVLCFFDPVLVVYVHSVRPGKMFRTGGCIVWYCGPGVLWIPSRISRSLCIIPLVILGCAYLGGFGRIGFGALARALRILASSPSDTPSFSGTHALLCSVLIPRRLKRRN